ncbi:MAG: hypothetical protein NZ899_05505 [Thermoguttaceae bacterium]|nr:hypothetical protein [Thermoguttaceae bacterium]MDW8078228.1 hypothetical protein [Thermoguttaceae bacterium]
MMTQWARGFRPSEIAPHEVAPQFLFQLPQFALGLSEFVPIALDLPAS